VVVLARCCIFDEGKEGLEVRRRQQRLLEARLRIGYVVLIPVLGRIARLLLFEELVVGRVFDAI
jgi:hypothetical protein